jgi:hypothetical protein
MLGPDWRLARALHWFQRAAISVCIGMCAGLVVIGPTWNLNVNLETLIVLVFVVAPLAAIVVIPLFVSAFIFFVLGAYWLIAFLMRSRREPA